MLHNYQKKVLEWMENDEKTPFGGIMNLAPGMGKTFTSLSYISKIGGDTLILMNFSQINVWREEMNKFFPDMNYRIVHRDFSCTLAHQLEKSEMKEIIIATYGSLKSVMTRNAPMASKVWTTIICDEIQAARNSNSLLYQYLKNLKRKKLFGLTGSLIHNSVRDARSLQSIVNDRCIYSMDNIYTLEEKDIGNRLPEMKQKIHVVQMNLLQRKIYEIYNLHIQKVIDNIGKENTNHSKNWNNYIVQLGFLRQICIAVDLLSKSHEFGNVNDANSIHSPKIEAICENIQKTKEQGLVFCSYRRSLELIVLNLKKKGIRAKIVKAEYDTNHKNKIIQEFRDGKYRILLFTYQVGSQGWNLTCANHVYFCGFWWTMEAIIQSLKRCWRPGQTKTTYVNLFVCENSIDQHMVEIAQQKYESSREFLSRPVEFNFTDHKKLFGK